MPIEVENRPLCISQASLTASFDALVDEDLSILYNGSYTDPPPQQPLCNPILSFGITPRPLVFGMSPRMQGTKHDALTPPGGSATPVDRRSSDVDASPDLSIDALRPPSLRPHFRRNVGQRPGGAARCEACPVHW